MQNKIDSNDRCNEARVKCSCLVFYKCWSLELILSTVIRPRFGLLEFIFRK